jgi:hypothetical protein
MIQFNQSEKLLLVAKPANMSLLSRFSDDLGKLSHTNGFNEF